MNVLVTGGAGFIGSNLAIRLIKEGHAVTVVDDLSIGRLSNLEPLSPTTDFRFVQDSILNASALEPLIREAEAIFHLAAVVGVQHILKDPLRGIKTNVWGTEVVVELAHRYGRRIVAASSSEVYGKSRALPLREDGDRVLGSTRIGRWSYAESKALDEHLILNFARCGLAGSAVRYFNSYGPRTNPDGYGSVVTRFVLQALSGRPITVFGDGTQTRCFTFVDDTVEGTIRAGLEERAVGEVFNIGDNREIAVVELAHRIRDLAGSNSEVVFVSYSQAFGQDFEEPARRVPDVTKAETMLGFRARVLLDDGLRKTIDWFRECEV